MQESDESQRNEQFTEPASVPRQISWENGKAVHFKEEATAHPLVSILDVKVPSTSVIEECAFLLVKGTELVTKFEAEANHLYMLAIERIKDTRSFFKTISNSANSKVYFNIILKIMKALGKALKVRNSAQRDLDLLIRQYIEMLAHEKAAVNMVEQTRDATFMPVPKREAGVQVDLPLHILEKAEGQYQGKAKKRKKITLSGDDQVLRKQKRIALGEVKKNFMKKQSSDILHMTNECQLCEELPNELLEQMKAMQQLLLQLQINLHVMKDKQQTMEGSKDFKESIKMLKSPEKKTKEK